MVKTSAGLLMYKEEKGILKLFLVHPGGPFWKNQEKGAWGIPKGEVEEHEKSNLLETAKREFWEETGIKPPKEEEKYIPLGQITQKSGKIVHGWAFQGDWTGLLMCQTFVDITWNKKKLRIPEVDKAGFFTIEKSKELINPAQFDLIKTLVSKLK